MSCNYAELFFSVARRCVGTHRRICRKAKLMNAKKEETELKLIYISFAY